MNYIYDYLFLVTWISYFVYWRLMAKDVKSSVRTESTLSRLIRAISIILAFLLLWIPKFPISLLTIRFLPDSTLVFWIGFVVTTGGLYFSVWARKCLGKNWSQAVTLKDDHQLIRWTIRNRQTPYLYRIDSWVYRNIDSIRRITWIDFRPFGFWSFIV